MEFAEFGAPPFVSVRLETEEEEEQGAEEFEWRNFDDSLPKEVEDWITRESNDIHTRIDYVEGARKALRLVEPYRALYPDLTMKELLEIHRKNGLH